MSTRTGKQVDAAGTSFEGSGSASESSGIAFDASSNPGAVERASGQRERTSGTSERIAGDTERAPGILERTSGRTERKIRVPIDELLREAATAATFLTTHAGRFASVDRSLATTGPTTLLAAIATAQAAQTEMDAVRLPASTLPLRLEARRRVTNMVQMCAYSADGNVDDLQLVTKLRARTRNESREGLALALEEWALMLERWRDRLEGLPGFNEATIADARALAAKLGAASIASRRKAERAKRDHALHIIVAMLARVRRTTRVVFPGDRAILREVTSAWGRRRRS